MRKEKIKGWRFKVGDTISEGVGGSKIDRLFGVKIVAKGPFIDNNLVITESYVVKHGNNLIVISRDEAEKKYKRR